MSFIAGMGTVSAIFEVLCHHEVALVRCSKNGHTVDQLRGSFSRNPTDGQKILYQMLAEEAVRCSKIT